MAAVSLSTSTSTAEASDNCAPWETTTTTPIPGTTTSSPPPSVPSCSQVVAHDLEAMRAESLYGSVLVILLISATFAVVLWRG